ncbi:MAG: cadmium-translocating P-type ATPase [candidate division Zixibacteria bacterium]|nr:cadmium-translocating P-type ATPase [candidate division Zixibacteria bacterium]
MQENKKLHSNIKITIDGLDCADCAAKLERDLGNVEGVKSARINFISKTADVDYNPDFIDDSEIQKFISKNGYAMKSEDKNGQKISSSKADIVLTSISGIAVLTGVALSYFDIPETFVIPVFILSIIVGGYKIAIKGIKAAVKLSLDMNFLMTIAVIGAVILGEWSEGAMVIFLFSLSHLLENKSMTRARKAISDLMDRTPKTALVIENDTEFSKPVETVKSGEVILIKPGEAIPLDGIVVRGRSSVNQAQITGESVPVKKLKGDNIYAGSMNGNGALRIEVTKIYSDSTLTKIMHLVEEAQSRRAPAQLFVERFARYYTPLVVAGAVLIAVIPSLFFGQPLESWFYRALVLLVIACPCALVISTPVSFVSGLTTAARKGVLIKGGSILEKAAHIDSVALDKTGTVTYGRPEVIDIVPVNGMTQIEVLEIAASLEKYSEHHIAGAVIERASGEKLRLDDVKRFKAIPGHGVQGEINEKKYYIANLSFFDREKYDLSLVSKFYEENNHRRNSIIIVADDYRLLGLLTIADKVRAESAEAVRMLKSSGIKEIFILSGDNEFTTKSINSEINCDYYHAELMPEDKLDIIRKYNSEGKKVAMIGDGINDAPALAASDLGIAMGTSGTDIALETADVAIIGDNLLKLPFLFKLAGRTLNIIKGNILIALGIKAFFVVLTITGYTTLWMAVFADMGGSLIVISNSLRILNTDS